jgi:potassium/chloride transporter 9
MISRTLGPEFGGAIGSLFFLANVVGCGLAITGCVEGLIQNLGKNGLLLPEDSPGLLEDGRWYRFGYCTIVNTLILIVVLIGAQMFAKTSAFILGIVVVCLFSTYVSFITKGGMDVSIPPDNTLLNRTEFPTLHYTGLSMQTLQENLYPNYGQDYTSGGSYVNFAIVFGVLFSGVTGIMAGMRY